MKTEIHSEGTCVEINLSRKLAGAIYTAIELHMEELPDEVLQAYRELYEHYEAQMLVGTP